jgi:hypothetical protein
MQRAPTFLSRYNPLADGGGSGGDKNFGYGPRAHDDAFEEDEHTWLTGAAA